MVISISMFLIVPIIIQSFLFALVLSTYKGVKKISNRLLGAFLAALGVQMTIYFLLDLELISANWLAGTGVVFAYGPLLYLYARSLIHKPFQLKSTDWLHFLPTILFIVLMLFGFDIRNKFGWLLYVSLGFYMLFAFQAINRYQKVIENTQSAPEKLTLNWLKSSFGFFTIIISADLISFLLNYTINWTIVNQTMNNLVFVMLLIFVNFLIYKGLKQPGIFQGISDEEFNLIRSTKQLNKQLIHKKHQGEITQLILHMEKEQPFMNPSLTIAELATQLAIPMRSVSEIVNGYFQQNFSEFINSYRIEAAKKYLENPTDPKETILEVLYKVGFQSKSAFNTAFKNLTGETPTAYKKKF